MVVGPFGTLVNRRYIADDGNAYVIGVWSECEGMGSTGDSNVAGLPAFPANWNARYMACAYVGSVNVPPPLRYVRVPCNVVAPGWSIGPGTTGLIGGRQYVVNECHGERRID